MDSLNDDCLFTIFKHLSIVDVIHVEEASPAFRGAAELYYRNIQRYVLLLRDMNPDYLERILERIGPTLKSFRFSGGFIMNNELKTMIIETIVKNCTNLHSLAINYITMEYDTHLASLLKITPNLIELNLGNCPLADDKLQPILKSSPGLRKLTLNGNSSLEGKCLMAVPQIQELDISICFEVKTENICDFICSCTKLRKLNVSGCFKLNRDRLIECLQLLQQPLEALFTLDHLTSDNSDNILIRQDICLKLPKLKQLNGKDCVLFK